MSIPQYIKNYLDANHVHYRHLVHSQQFVAPRVAESLHISGRDYAKTVVVLVENSAVMAVLPANARLDLERIAELTGASTARLATEEELDALFPGCETGAMPALGDLYDMPVWLDAGLETRPRLAFDAGTHVDTIQMQTVDFRRLVGPRVASLTARQQSTSLHD